MEDWVDRALKRWPNVPALYGWLRLDRHGRWLIQGEPITRWQIVETINRNYAADARGCWYFQNGPQRGYMELDYAPLILRAEAGDSLIAHTGTRVARLSQAFIDEDGALIFVTEHGPGLLADDHLDWALERLRVEIGKEDGARDALNEQVLDERQLTGVLAQPSGTSTSLIIQIGVDRLPVSRLDSGAVPETLGFVRVPEPNHA